MIFKSLSYQLHYRKNPKKNTTHVQKNIEKEEEYSTLHLHNTYVLVHNYTYHSFVHEALVNIIGFRTFTSKFCPACIIKLYNSTRCLRQTSRYLSIGLFENIVEMEKQQNRSSIGNYCCHSPMQIRYKTVQHDLGTSRFFYWDCRFHLQSNQP